MHTRYRSPCTRGRGHRAHAVEVSQRMHHAMMANGVRGNGVHASNPTLYRLCTHPPPPWVGWGGGVSCDNDSRIMSTSSVALYVAIIMHAPTIILKYSAYVMRDYFHESIPFSPHPFLNKCVLDMQGNQGTKRMHA